MFKIIDSRNQRCSTTIITNIDVKAWGDYLEDAPLAMAFTDRLADSAIVIKLTGKSYRAHRAKQMKQNGTSAESKQKADH